MCAWACKCSRSCLLLSVCVFRFVSFIVFCCLWAVINIIYIYIYVCTGVCETCACKHSIKHITFWLKDASRILKIPRRRGLYSETPRSTPETSRTATVRGSRDCVDFDDLGDSASSCGNSIRHGGAMTTPIFPDEFGYRASPSACEAAADDVVWTQKGENRFRLGLFTLPKIP